MGAIAADSIMLPHRTRGRGWGQKTMALIEASIGILEMIQPASVRAVAYQLFNRRLIATMGKNETDKVSRALTTARERGLIPWDWIVDETRKVERDATWDDPAAYADAVLGSYRRNWWADQPQRLLVISEKGTVGGTLRPVLRQYGVPFLVLHGFGSATALNDLAGFSAEGERPLTLLYVGDHDPSGRHMSDVDIPERLRRYGGEAELVRLAVMPRHIRDHNLLTFPAATKIKDSRHPWFVKHHGQTCCELDALDPNVLRSIVERTIVDRIDQDRWQRAQTVEAAERASIRDFVQTWKATLGS